MKLFFELVSFMWKYILPLTLVMLGLLLHVQTKGRLLTKLFYGIKVIKVNWVHESKLGITPLTALMIALSSTVGIGNIAGVLLAIQLGGPGALFWMWMLGVLSISMKYSETMLAHKYRLEDHGRFIGGPMVYIKEVFKNEKLARIYAIFAVLSILLGIGVIPQVHMVLDVFTNTFDTPLVLTAISLTLIVTYLAFGGLRNVSHMAMIIMPVMLSLFILGSLYILLLHVDQIPQAFVLIFKSAFGANVMMGASVGYSVKHAIEHGIKRGIFSSESALGSATFASSQSFGVHSVEQGYVHILEVLIDTFVINTITGLTFIITGVYKLTGTNVTLIELAFIDDIGIGRIVVILGLIFFAFTTTVAWSYYGSECARYLKGEPAVKLFRSLFVLMVLVSSFWEMKFIWDMSDATMMMMMIPNMIALFALNKIVGTETNNYFEGENKHVTTTKTNSSNHKG